MKLTDPQRDLLWTVAQHKYGWIHVGRHRAQMQVAEALVRRGLVAFNREGSYLAIQATATGCEEVARRWPVSPFVLDTYEHQPGGWTPAEGLSGDDTLTLKEER